MSSTVIKSKKPAATEVTTEQPRLPEWDKAREAADQCRQIGRLFLRGQVRLGMILAALKKEMGIRKGKGVSTSPDSGEVLPWNKLVERETGYSRQSADAFIHLYEAAKAKLKSSKKLALPAPAKKDAIVLFRTENPLSLTKEQWELVDDVIGTVTDGETQASLMQALGVVPKPKPLPAGGKKDAGDEPTAGQLAFHFFEAMLSPLFNARTSPDYKRLLLALPSHADEENGICLNSLEAEARALLADIEEAKKANAKSSKGPIVEV